MLKVEIIGCLGADAEIKDVNGKRFATCRVAHSEKYTDSTGTKVEKTLWVDITMHMDTPCLGWLKKGTQVFIRGNADLRVYSSEKDKCMKAGLTIHAAEIQLLSAQKKEDNNDTDRSGENAPAF